MYACNTHDVRALDMLHVYYIHCIVHMHYIWCTLHVQYSSFTARAVSHVRYALPDVRFEQHDFDSDRKYLILLHFSAVNLDIKHTLIHVPCFCSPDYESSIFS